MRKEERSEIQGRSLLRRESLWSQLGLYLIRRGSRNHRDRTLEKPMPDKKACLQYLKGRPVRTVMSDPEIESGAVHVAGVTCEA